MKHSKFTKVVAFALCVTMLISIVPNTVFASIANWSENNVTYSGTTFGTDGYYNVISKKDYVLVPGAATETEMVLNNSDGSRRQVIHVIEVDPSNPDVSIIPGYYGIDKFAEDPTNTAYHKAAGVTTMAAYYEDTLGYNVVGAMNTALAYDCNAPYSYLVYNGEVLVDAKNGVNNFHTGGCQTLLCVYKDAVTGECSVELRTSSQGLRGDEWQAIGANFAMVVNNGQLVTTKVTRASDDAARSMVGVKEDGTLVLVMNDGRGANNSKGFSSYEEGECMLALGCKWAFNCDGGGSSSFVTRRAGEEDLTMRCVPCDGAERPTLNSVLIVSNVAPTGILDTINIESEYDIFAPNTTYSFGTKAIDTHGFAMEMPSDATWALSDESFGTVSNGVFVSGGKLGTVKVQVLSNGTVFGEKEITVANPTTLKFAQASTVIPYGRSTNLEIVSMIGEANVYIDGNSFAISSSTPAAGSLNGLVFTATTDETVAGTTITANYKATNTNIVFNIELGKGSEIIWDFEDGDLHGFLGQQDAYDWQLAHGVEKPFDVASNSLIVSGQISTDVSSTAFIASEANGGKVHNGKYALGYTFDMTQDAFNEWTYAVIYNVSNINGDVVLRDVANGKKATKFGCWVYVPYGFYTKENSGALALQANLFGGATKETAAQIGLNMQYNGKNLNALTENDIPENRWVYVVADISGYNYVSLVDPLQTNFRSPSVMRMYVKPSVAQVLTYYFDEFTLDYSSAVDDRIPPTISNPQYATSDTNIAFTDGVTITDVSAAYTATISDDNSGIDAATAAIYIDGNKVASTQVVGNTMFCDNVALGVGIHKVKFEIADKLGNYTTLTRTIVSNTEDHYMKARTRIEIEGHNDSGTTPMPGSVYYIDVTSSYADNFGTAVFTLELNTANAWILDQLVAAEGYEVEYKVDGVNPNKVTFTVTSDRANGHKRVIFSVPVRVYNPLLTNGTSDGSAVVVSGKTFVAPLSVELTSCTYAGSYGNYCYFSVAAMDAARKIDRHEHTAHAIEDKAAELGVDGYTGRTYCDVCQSIVDFGTTIPAIVHTHSYELVDGKFVCSDETCGEVYEAGTGLFEMNGKAYYAIGGSLIEGWQEIDGVYYLFKNNTFEAYTGSYKFGPVTYSFGENGALSTGAWYYDGNGTRYYYGPDYYRCTAANTIANGSWYTINGNTYCFDREGYRHEGICVIKSSNNPAMLYEFTDEGILVGEYYTNNYTGIFVCNKMTTYLKDGMPFAAGLVKDGEDYYYIASNCIAVTGNYDVTRPNGLLLPGFYQFGADGKMINPPVYGDGPQQDGFFYKDGQRLMAYQLVAFDGSYYFINDYNKYAKDISIYLSEQYTEGTDILPGYHYFDKSGKMVIESGPAGDGYFYLGGVRQNAYQLILFEGNYYFINDGNKYSVNQRVYLGSQYVAGTNLAVGYYDFDDEGRLIIKNGPNSDGFFYLNGVRQNAYQLILFEGDYYFINDAHKYAKGIRLYMSDPFVSGTGLSVGYYDFDDEGKLVTKNGPNPDGFFYLNGVRQNAYQLIWYEGSYYFINDCHKYAKSITLFMSEKFISGTDLATGYYYFDQDGKMLINEKDEKNGPNQDGYFYLNGIRQSAYQLIKYEGNYYFINDSHKYARNLRLYMGSSFVANTGLAVGYYDFDEAGKMVVKNGPNADGYFYLNNVRQNAYQLIEFEGDYYFINDGHKYAAGKTLYLGSQFVEGTVFEPGSFFFDETGKMVVKNGPQPDGYFYINGVRQKAYQLVKYDGDYYFIYDGNQIAKNKYIDVTENYVEGTDLRRWYYEFDDEGKMMGYYEGVPNGRDIGKNGYLSLTTDGKKIKEGLLIRGCELDNANYYYPEEIISKGIERLQNEFAVKTDMDLRSPYAIGSDVFNESVAHKTYDMAMYDQVFTEAGKEKVRLVFADLANPENYPIYLHCTHGIDRTGTVCFILEMVLGVSYSNLCKEYMFSVGANGNSILKVYNGINNNYPGATLKDKAEAYLKDCGLTQEQIDSLRVIFLEP